LPDEGGLWESDGGIEGKACQKGGEGKKKRKTEDGVLRSDG
jgi:hypothetical protein